VAGEFGWRKGARYTQNCISWWGLQLQFAFAKRLQHLHTTILLHASSTPHSHSLFQRNWQNGMTKFCTQLTILNRISKDGAAFLAPLSAENLITFCLFCVLTNRIIGPKVRPVTAASPQLSHSNSWPHLRAGFGFRLWFRVGFGMFNECRAKFWKTWAILK